MKCPYCGTLAQAPAELWQPIEQAQSASRWRKWIMLFVVVTIVFSTCLGLAGAVVGIGGSILAAIIPVILSFFVH